MKPGAFEPRVNCIQFVQPHRGAFGGASRGGGARRFYVRFAPIVGSVKLGENLSLAIAVRGDAVQIILLGVERGFHLSVEQALDAARLVVAVQVKFESKF